MNSNRDSNRKRTCGAERFFGQRQRDASLAMLNARQPEGDNAFDQERNLRAIGLLERFARRFKLACDHQSLREVVRLLVAASGHDVHEVRDRANVALERVFAPKPFDAPIATSFANVRKGQVHRFAFDLPRKKVHYFIRLYSSTTEELPLENELCFTDIDLHYDGTERAYVADYQFRELGHYDYLVCRKKRQGVRWLTRSGLSGRINVIPDLHGEIVLEIFPDIHGHTRLYWHDTAHPGLVYNENGEVLRLARFSDVTAHLDDLKRRYHVSALYLLGAQKRGTNGEDWTPEASSPSPFAPLSLTEMEPSLGGDEELRALIDRAHALGIKVILDLIPHLNRKSREVPDEFAVQCLDEAGNLVTRASTDGRYGSWNDGKLLNYRKLDVWEWLTAAVAKLIDSYGIDGVRFDSCHAMPIMMKKNNQMTVQGHERSDEEMVEGTVIANDREDEHFITTGYYECSCCEEIGSPFHYYFMRTIERTLRKKGKDFFVTLAECYWGRERYLSRAGIVPYNAALFKICENIIHGTTDVRELYHLYDNYLPSVLSPGTELLGILGNHDERRPLNTFGLYGLRAAATLTSFMSDIVMDYEGSAEGESWKVYPDNIYVDWNRFDYASHRSLGVFYQNLYERHRTARGTGYLIWANNHKVAAVAKFNDNEAWIAACNFSESTETVSLQFDRPDLPIDDDAFYRVIDAVYSSLTGHSAWYTGRELRRSRLHTVVSYTERTKIFRVEKMQQPGVFYADFLRDSLIRLCSIGEQAELNDNFAFREIASHLDSLDDFASFLSGHLVPLAEQIDSHFVELGVKRSLYYTFRNGRLPAEKLHSYLEALPSCGGTGVQRLGEALGSHMQRGSWVFISAEAEPFSKAGGIGDVVGHLPRELARLGEEVYVITPSYRDGDPRAVSKMQEALDQHRVAYTGTNVRFKIQDDEYEVGVHRGTVNGVGYFLLDHHEFFDGLYWGYTAAEKLRRRIAFARACAELIVVFGLKPMATFTNDAYAGIFNGITRTDSVYFRNPNFQRTSFFHIVHNGGWQYFDCYDRYELGFDHFRLFNLPDAHAGGFSDPTFGERINCMAAGVRFADRVITVSPKYAAELTLAGGGLERVLRGITGINNGIRRDFLSSMLRRFHRSGFVETWYPRFIERLGEDALLRRKVESRYPELLETAYSCDSITDPVRRALVTRMRNKLLLQLEHGLIVDPDRVLFTMIHRLVEQKGFQLLLEASERIFAQLGCEAIVGGPLAPFDGRGEELARGLESLQARYSGQVSVSIGLQDICIPLLASDVFLMPSLYEPGGIAQLEALACGCLVVARATGGLQDTVKPVAVNGGRIRGNGFLFAEATPTALYEAMLRCTQFFDETQEELIQQVRSKGQHAVHYWDRTARQYLDEIYSTKEIVPFNDRRTESGDAARSKRREKASRVFAEQHEFVERVELSIRSSNIGAPNARQGAPQGRILRQVRKAFPGGKSTEPEQFDLSDTSRPGATRHREV